MCRKENMEEIGRDATGGWERPDQMWKRQGTLHSERKHGVPLHSLCGQESVVLTGLSVTEGCLRASSVLHSSTCINLLNPPTTLFWFPLC